MFAIPLFFGCETSCPCVCLRTFCFPWQRVVNRTINDLGVKEKRAGTTKVAWYLRDEFTELLLQVSPTEEEDIAQYLKQAADKGAWGCCGLGCLWAGLMWAGLLVGWAAVNVLCPTPTPIPTPTHPSSPYLQFRGARGK